MCVEWARGGALSHFTDTLNFERGMYMYVCFNMSLCIYLCIYICIYIYVTLTPIYIGVGGCNEMMR
jgi:hypothetical protein